MNVLFDLLANIATAAAATGSTKCVWFTFDEPECPTELL